MLIKGIGLFLLILMVVAVKSSYTGRAVAFVVVVGALLWLGLSSKRR